MRIALAAEESAGVQTLRLVADSVHEACAVLTASNSADRARGLTVAAVTDELGIDTLPGAAVRDPSVADVLRARGVDVLLNVHSLYLVHPAVLAAPRFGSFNLHPGPLPRYAGLNTPNWALYQGETTHGVTLHWMAPGIDTATSDAKSHMTAGSRGRRTPSTSPGWCGPVTTARGPRRGAAPAPGVRTDSRSLCDGRAAPVDRRQIRPARSDGATSPRPGSQPGTSGS
jgi:folate-dependent phosphoribosylglycinamide formyltransferase PurN